MKIKFVLIVACILFINTAFAEEQKPPAVEIQDRISLDIKGMDIVDVLKMLATRSGMNIVVGKNVAGKVSLFLKDVAIQDAFEIILLANDLAYEKKGDIINVMTQRDYELIYGERYEDKKEVKVIPLKYAKAVDLSRALTQIKSNIGKIVVDEGSNTLVLIDLAQKLKEMEDFLMQTDLPIQTRVFSLNYAQADKIGPKIQEALTKGVGSLKIDERTNKIAVTDYPEKINEIANIINAFDEKTAQVLIDAQIIEIRPTDTYEAGVDWDFWIKNHFKLANALPMGTSGRLLIGSSFAPTERGDYKAMIDLLRTIGDTKILSSPRIMTLNNQEAKILVGTKDAYITSATSQTGETAVTSQTVNFVDVGIKLYVTPTINRDGFITMKIKPEVSSAERTNITAEGVITQVPIVTTSEVETTVMVKDGITIIIGGLSKDTKEKTVKKIPVLGDIPLLGIMFRNKTEEISKTELVVLLTPHVISGAESYTDFAEIKPKEGMVVTMTKGELVKEKIVAPAQEKDLREISSSEYYSLVWDKVKRSAAFIRPQKEKGIIQVAFTLSKDGRLVGEPFILDTDNTVLGQIAVRAIKNASPFPPFPKSIEKNREIFKINLAYK